jgi:Tfp pilus assembly protein PilO
MTPKRFFFVLGGLLALIIIAGGAAYYFASISLTTGTATLSQRLADEQLTTQRLADLNDLQSQYQHLAPLIPVVNEALPNQKNQSDVANQLHGIAANCNMALDSLNFSPSTLPGPTSQTVAAGGVLAIPITFQLHGTYSQLQQFLQQQENLSRYTSVTSLSITGTGNSLSFSIALSAYMKP